jgi:hypothetical protein
MASSHLFRLGKIKGDNGVLNALKHNKRTLQSERGASANIDVTRTSLNYSLTGDATPKQIALYAKSQMILAGIEKPRKDQVRAVEVLFSLPIDRHQQDTRQFFNDCYEWVKQAFAGELLSFEVHLDESAPHAHAIILPLIDGKMLGRDMVGNTGNLMRLINMFHSDVATHYGLSRSESKRLTNVDKQTMAKQVISRLKADPAIHSIVWDCFRDLIYSDPMPFVQKLSIKLPLAKQKKNKSFVQIMTSKGKGGNTNAI